MKAVARLVYSYFTCSRAMTVFTLVGLVLILVSVWVVTSLPQSEHMLAFAFSGIACLFIGSSLMPLMVGRLAQSHGACILPGARVKLLMSVIITVLLVALPIGLLMPLALVAGVSGQVMDLFNVPGLFDYALNGALITYTEACLIFAWLYVMLWFITSRRDMAGFAKAMLVLLALLFVPAREIRELSANISRNLVQMAAFALVFGTGFLLWPRLKAGYLARRQRRATTAPATARVISGKEVDLMLGTSNPWLWIATQVLPIAIAARIGRFTPDVWLFYFTLLSTVSGAIAGQAAERSRALWLRGDWSRERLFSAVERSFWRHNGVVLAALIVAMLGIGKFAGIPAALLAVGPPLLVLGTVLSTYLGLMVTRTIGWLEGSLGVVIVLGLMAVALWVAREDARRWWIVATLAALAVAAAVLRKLASMRWKNLDWMQCRPDRAAVLRRP